jgi:hypothetical protein
VKGHQLHSPQQAQHIKQRIEGGREFGVFEKSSKVSCTAASEASRPPRFETEVALKMIQMDLTVDFAV